jgi:hypothetical protein
LHLRLADWWDCLLRDLLARRFPTSTSSNHDSTNNNLTCVICSSLPDKTLSANMTEASTAGSDDTVVMALRKAVVLYTSLQVGSNDAHHLRDSSTMYGRSAFDPIK